MKNYSSSGKAPRGRGAVLGILALLLTCAVGGGDPVAQVEAARVARDQLDAAGREGREGAEAVAAASAEGEVDYVDFAEASAPERGRVEARETAGPGRVTVSLDDVTLEDTVRLFAQTAGANIIAAGTLLEGLRVTANLRDVHWHPALSSILEVHNLSLVERTPGSGVYNIQAKVPDAPEPTLVETFFLDFATVVEVEDPVKAMLRPGSTLTTFPSRNAMVVRSTENNLREVRDLLSTLDRPGRQVLIETKIMELSDDAEHALGIHGGSLGAFNVRAGIGPFSETRKTTETLERGSFDQVRDSRNQASTRRSLLRPSGANADVSLNNTDVIGGEYGSIRETPLGYDAGSERFSYSGRESASGSSVVDSFVRSIVKEQSAILSMDSLNLVLSALETMDGVSVVSNPKMIVTSGSTNAYFSVGERWPIVESEVKRGTQASPGDTITAKLMDTKIQTSLIEGGYFRTGIDMRVIATVKTDDYIEANINPTLRRKIGEKSVRLSEEVANTWPEISIREINTTFSLKSGQTVAIGGLTDTVDSKKVARVPFLGRIPLIGKWLFTHEENVKKQVETIIFVTLSVANPGELDEHAGVPENAQLVYQRRLKEQVSIENVQKQIAAQRAAVEAAAAAPASPETAEAEAAVIVEKPRAAKRK